MSAERTCSRCGSEHLEPGALIDRANRQQIQFKPAHKRFFTFRGGADVYVYACMDCGSLEMSTDVDAVRALLKHESVQTPSPDEPSVCLGCGAKIDPTRSVCPSCGWSYPS